MELSDFGNRFFGNIGISELMDDLGKALDGERPMLMLGGGNPSHIPAVQTYFRERMANILAEPGAFERIIGDYDTPQGAKLFIEALADRFRTDYGWDIAPGNIALTNGSQNSFFYLFNMFAGIFGQNRRKKILLPMTPEYIGYTDVGLHNDFFKTTQPTIERIDESMFKYHIDLNALKVNSSIGAICVSRPTNPTGNVITDDEMQALLSAADRHDIPLIIDNAYGTPFPNIIYEDARPVWNKDTVVCMSLSKFGLPGLRTGIIIAHEAIIRLISRMTAVFSLAPGSMGAALALEMIRSGDINQISRDVIRPYYQKKAQHALTQIKTEVRGLPVAVHKPEGALFLWLWCEGLPITSAELYMRLKKRGVLVVPGHYFFPGLKRNWKHRDECIRVTYAQDDAIVEKGLTIIADEIRSVYANSKR